MTLRNALLVLFMMATLSMGVIASDTFKDGLLRGLKTGSHLGNGGSYNNYNKPKPHRRRYECSAHRECVAVGLTTGDCCPTSDDVFLDCCTKTVVEAASTVEKVDSVPPSDSPSTTPSMTPSRSIIDDATCSVHAACANLGLTGSCCPTADGITLDCCTN